MAHPYISELINAEEVLDAAFKQPGMQLKPRSKKLPTIDMATKAVLVEIEKAVIDTVMCDMVPKLRELYEGYVLMEGEYEDAEDKDAWTTPLDEQVEAAIAEYVPVLSISWLGENTIDCGLYEPNGIHKFCTSLGKEYYKQLTYGKGKNEPGKVLANAGIMPDTIKARLELHTNPTEEEKQTMATEQDTDLQAVYEKIAEHIGPDHDAMAVYDDLDMALDDDDGLAYGAGLRLGIDAYEVETLRLVSFEHGKDGVDIAQQAIQAIIDGAPAPKKAKPAPKAKKAPEPVEEDSDDEAFAEAPAAPAPRQQKKAPANEAMAASVLATVKDLGAGDTDTSKGIGVSRQTYVNYVQGKTDFKPTEEQKAFIRGILVDKANAALEAIASIDGTEAETVF